MFTDSFDLWKVEDLGGSLAFHGGVCRCRSAFHVVFHYGLGVVIGPEHLSALPQRILSRLLVIPVPAMIVYNNAVHLWMQRYRDWVSWWCGMMGYGDS